MYNRVAPENRRRRMRVRHLIRTALRIMCPFFLLLTLGLVGGMEMERLGLLPGCLLTLASSAGMVLSAWFGGLME